MQWRSGEHPRDGPVWKWTKGTNFNALSVKNASILKLAAVTGAD